jgi:hypothetical protein
VVEAERRKKSKKEGGERKPNRPALRSSHQWSLSGRRMKAEVAIEDAPGVAGLS